MAYVGADPAAARDDHRPEPTGRNMVEPGDFVAAIVAVRGDDGRVRLYALNPDAAISETARSVSALLMIAVAEVFTVQASLSILVSAHAAARALVFVAAGDAR